MSVCWPWIPATLYVRKNRVKKRKGDGEIGGLGELYIRLAYRELSLRSGGLTNSSISGLLCVIFFFLTVREPFRSFVKNHIVYISHSYTRLYICMYVWVRLKHIYKPFPHVFFSVLSRLSDSDSLLLLNYLLPVSSSSSSEHMYNYTRQFCDYIRGDRPMPA